MARVRRSEEEQYKLIMECRSSGLSDFQWCRENDINPATFYNWVSRLRRKACEIPDPSEAEMIPLEAQDVVRLQIKPDPVTASPLMREQPQPILSEECPAPIVIRLRDASISLQNSVDPALLGLILHSIGDRLC